MNRSEIVEHVGANNWKMIEQTWSGAAPSAILAELDEMFPTEENKELAEAIYWELLAG